MPPGSTVMILTVLGRLWVYCSNLPQGFSTLTEGGLSPKYISSLMRGQFKPMAISFHQSATVQLWYTATAVQSAVFWPSHVVCWALGSRPLLLVLRGLLLLLGLLVLRNLLLGLGFLILWALLLVGLVCRGLLLVRSTEEA